MDQDKNKLWKNYWETGDEADHLTIVNVYIGMLADIADSICPDNLTAIQKDWIISFSVFALNDAVKSYPSNSKISFEEYCMPLVKQAMLDDLENYQGKPPIS